MLTTRSTKSGASIRKPLRGCVFVIEGFRENPEKENALKDKILSWGGKADNIVTKHTTALILPDKGKLFWQFCYFTM